MQCSGCGSWQSANDQHVQEAARYWCDVLAVPCKLKPVVQGQIFRLHPTFSRTAGSRSQTLKKKHALSKTRDWSESAKRSESVEIVGEQFIARRAFLTIMTLRITKPEKIKVSLCIITGIELLKDHCSA